MRSGRPVYYPSFALFVPTRHDSLLNDDRANAPDNPNWVGLRG